MAITDIERVAGTPKTMTLFFIIDTSGSMAGWRIGAVNSAVEETLVKLREMNADSADVEIEIAILEFSSGAKWLTPNGPVKVDNYYWGDLDAEGLTSMGEAFRMLEEKLHHTSGFLDSWTGSYAPVLFLMSDGEPNDDYRTYLALLKNNDWFKQAIKVALAICDEAKDQVLEEFTGSKESVVHWTGDENAGEKLSKLITTIAVRVSKIASYSQNTTKQSKQKQADNLLRKIDKDDDDDDDEYDVD